MRWFIFVIVAVGILLVFAAVYGITYLINQRKRPKYKTTAPDDDPKFLRDLAQKLKDQPNQDQQNLDQQNPGPEQSKPDQPNPDEDQAADPDENRPSDK